ncbi:mechanosensitive ion channel [Amphritea sp. 2_MG-2023]|uniref:mechanosensitive ion channel domain-containing protein n=1 Tax=Amphritea TaxID=515417 RepID=UPI001C073D9F|nr:MULTISPECIES: mechanosensitive ion channel domain-containing protein [Amphritea]MBU2965935.1 mechanosensitive ion channel family protein [Amphritea atlantica]MDO6418025.1 mechanosensitive ion channel [Amphritea sp. 2_MG-2023]
MKYVIVLAVIAVYALAIRFINRHINRLGELKGTDPYRLKYIAKTLNIALTVLFFTLLTLILGIQYAQLSVFLSSVFAIIGVAMFAQWSILSNITASLIIFFGFPYRVGDSIKVVDKDDDISGIVDEITLFHVIIRRQGEIITYPNTLILQKAVIKFDHPVPNKETTEAVIHEPALDTKTTAETQPTDVRPKET